MDLHQTIQELYAEKEKLERVISSLEQLQSYAQGQFKVSKRRGRKFMDTAERQQVSARMKKYWASRRSKAAAG